MTHLTRDRLLALAEQEPAGAQDAHLASCGRCRAEVDALRAVLREAAQIDVPEPSPLFWEHLSRRVTDAVREEAVPAGRSSWTHGWGRLAPLAAALATVIAASLVLWSPGRVQPTDSSAAGTVSEGAADSQAAPVPGDDEAWQVVASLTDGIDVETVDATGICPAPGSVEEAVRELSADERMELIRILRAETTEPDTEG